MPPRKRPTILDVAAASGVSKSTVSLVLRNSTQVSADKREAVRRAMVEVGYVYNRAAAQMRSQATRLIGLIVDDLRAPATADLATDLQLRLAEAGYATIIATSAGVADHQTRLIGSMIENGVSALLLVPVHGDGAEGFEHLARAGLPTLQLLRKASDRIDLFPVAGFDDAAGAARATRHLINQGATRIAFVGGQEGCVITRQRTSGYLAEVDRAGLPPITRHGDSSHAFGVSAVGSLPDGVDAAVCFDDLVALGMLAGLAREGIAAGKEFRVVGFGDSRDCTLAWPPLTSVVCDTDGFAEGVAQTVVAWVEDGITPPQQTLARVDLTARSSSTGRTP